jgi:hypothetical protein
MDFQGRHVVVTGGTGALGEAVVGTLLAAGASCHVPYRREQEAIRFAHRNHNQLSLVPLGDLTDERSVTAFLRRFEHALGIHSHRGGLCSRPHGAERQSAADGTTRFQLDISMPVQPGRRRRLQTWPGAGLHRQCRGSSGFGATARRKPDGLHRIEDRRGRSHCGTGGGGRSGGNPGECGCAVDHGYARESPVDAPGGFRCVAQSG